jgi:hypothetical protein
MQHEWRGEECICSILRKSLGKPKRRWVNDIKTDLREIRWGGVDWIDLAQGNQHSCSIKFWAVLQ